MNAVLAITAIGWVGGFAWGFLKPATYCHLGREGAKALSNRLGSGAINGVIVGAIVGLIAYFALGQP